MSSSAARAPFEAPGGVQISPRDGLGIATVLLRKGAWAALEQRVRESFHLDLPQGPRRAARDQVAFAGVGPGAWLATQESGGNAFATSLAGILGGVASISDQSDGYAVFRVTGPRVRETLAKLVPIDLHPRAFRPGDVAATLAAHVGITLWRVDDPPDGSVVFDLALFRSLTSYFLHALAESAARR